MNKIKKIEDWLLDYLFPKLIDSLGWFGIFIAFFCLALFLVSDSFELIFGITLMPFILFLLLRASRLEDLIKEFLNCLDNKTLEEICESNGNYSINRCIYKFANQIEIKYGYSLSDDKIAKIRIAILKKYLEEIKSTKEVH